MSPELALAMWANAGRCRHGPVWPKPEMEQYTMSGLTARTAS
jgi:hypothetical protein